MVGKKLTGRSQDTHSYRQIVGTSFFSYVSRSHIHDDFLSWKRTSKTANSRFDTLISFFNRIIWQTYKVIAYFSSYHIASYINFNSDGNGIYSLYSAGIGFY